jgi:predicted nucleic-acid-binding protein
VIAVDTNILARYYVDDTTDQEAKSQRRIAEKVMRESDSIFVSVTVVLELYWVLQAFYEFEVEECCRVIQHLVGLSNVTVEDWPAVIEAARLHDKGLDFADALHLARAGQCDAFYTFDDRKFARRAQRMKLQPMVSVPK